MKNLDTLWGALPNWESQNAKIKFRQFNGVKEEGQRKREESMDEEPGFAGCGNRTEALGRTGRRGVGGTAWRGNGAGGNNSAEQHQGIPL